MRGLSCGVAKKMPAGFLKEEIPELKTVPGVNPQGECEGCACGCPPREDDVCGRSWADVVGLGLGPSLGPAAGSSGWQGGRCGVWGGDGAGSGRGAW